MQVEPHRRVVLAPDKFKGTVPAARLVEAMESAVADTSPWVTAAPLPLADGGDGSVASAVLAGWSSVVVRATDAWGAPVHAPVARLDRRAIVEVAAICGLGARRPTPADARKAGTFGVGEAVAALLDDGADDITLALGGSATTDAGTGMLRALGLDLRDGTGRALPPGGAALDRCARVDTSALHPGLARTRLTLACDVDTPMVGADGSAEMFARQKGADDRTIAQLSAALSHCAPLLEDAFCVRGARARPGAGAAGGLAWAGLLLGGRIRSGAEVFLDLLGARDQIRGADLVITGEGRLDEQSLRGKAPVAVAEFAAALGVRTVAIVGSDRLGPQERERAPFTDVVSLDRIDPGCARDPELTRRLVYQATRDLLQTHLRPAAPLRNGAAQ